MAIFRHLSISSLLLASVLGPGCSKEVKIGAVISETGAVAPYGREVRKGFDLALEEINAAGGFNGAPVEILYRDDASNPEVGQRVVEELIKGEGVKVIVGPISSAVAVRVAPYCEERRVIMMSPSASTPRISDLGEYIYRNYPSDVLEGTAMADFARGVGVRRVVVIALDNEFGAGLRQVFTDRFESKSRQVVESFQFHEGDRAAIEALVPRVHALEPEGIYIVAYLDDLATILTQLQAAGVRSMLMGSGAVTENLPKLVGEAAENLVYPQPSFDPKSPDPAVSRFVEAFRAKYDKVPDIYAAHGYDALRVVWTAMRETGSSHPDDIRRGLHGLESYEGAAGRTTFDERGDVVRYPRLFVVHGGQSVPYEQFEQDGGVLPIPGR